MRIYKQILMQLITLQILQFIRQGNFHLHVLSACQIQCKDSQDDDHKNIILFKT